MTGKTINTKKLLTGLKEHWGAIQKVVDKSGKTRKAVMDILNGKYQNLQVLKIAAQVLKEYEDEKKSIANMVNSI